jgi:thiosulfate/3-mercaptopyruvate sulfurtransferase
MSIANLPLIIEPEQLEAILDEPKLLVVDLCQASVYRQFHVPGAVHVRPAELVCGIPPATGKLPTREQLAALLSRIGFSDERAVVAYDDEGGGWAGRFLWTLDVIGHSNHALLNGGIHAWRNEGFPLETRVAEPQSTDYQPTIDHGPIADLEAVLAQLDRDDSIVWDARSAEEYHGVRQSSLRSGHIPGAVNLDWLETMDRNNNLRLLPLEQLRDRLEALGISADKQIITHCQTHHRSGLTYIIGRALGFNIRAYDGSWSEWGNHPGTPIEI